MANYKKLTVKEVKATHAYKNSGNVRRLRFMLLLFAEDMQQFRDAFIQYLDGLIKDVKFQSSLEASLAMHKQFHLRRNSDKFSEFVKTQLSQYDERFAHGMSTYEVFLLLNTISYIAPEFVASKFGINPDSQSIDSNSTCNYARGRCVTARGKRLIFGDASEAVKLKHAARCNRAPKFACYEELEKIYVYDTPSIAVVFAVLKYYGLVCESVLYKIFMGSCYSVYTPCTDKLTFTPQALLEKPTVVKEKPKAKKVANDQQLGLGITHTKTTASNIEESTVYDNIARINARLGRIEQLLTTLATQSSNNTRARLKAIIQECMNESVKDGLMLNILTDNPQYPKKVLVGRVDTAANQPNSKFVEHGVSVLRQSTNA